MKILVIIDSPFSQKNIYPRRFEKIMSYLVSKKCEVIVYCKFEVGLQREEIRDGIKIKRVFDKLLGTTEKIDFYLQAHIQLFNSIDKNFDIIYCVDTMTLPFGSMMKNMFGGKLVFDCYEYFPDYIEEKWYGENKKKFELTKLLLEYRGKYIKNADEIIVVSNEMSQQLKSDFELNKFPNTIYNSDFNINRNKNIGSLKEEFNLINKKIILFQGIVEESRGIESLIEILKYMEDYSLVLAGKIKNEYLNELNSFIETLRLNKRVIFTGYKTAEILKSYTYEADCFIYAPYIKVENINLTLPNKIFDYMEAKKPIIVNEAKSLKNLVERTGTGISIDFSKYSYEGIAIKIKEYIDLYDSSYINYKELERRFSNKNMELIIDEMLERLKND
ncbi:MAG: glycosyltransferase family 4 protein [Sarcina sp.]